MSSIRRRDKHKYVKSNAQLRTAQAVLPLWKENILLFFLHNIYAWHKAPNAYGSQSSTYQLKMI